MGKLENLKNITEKYDGKIEKYNGEICGEIGKFEKNYGKIAEKILIFENDKIRKFEKYGAKSEKFEKFDGK